MTDYESYTTQENLQAVQETGSVVLQESSAETDDADISFTTYIFMFFGIVGWVLIFLLLKWVFRKEYWQN